MHVVRTFRMSAAVAAATLVVGAVGTGTAFAGKPLPKPTGLTADVTAHPGGTYDVAASWNRSASATAYRVALTEGGATLVSTTVTSNSWARTITATPGTATLSVRAVVGKKPGRVATTPVVLDDVTAPSGSYSADSDNVTGIATITQDSLGDDSGAGQVTRTVAWGDGSQEAWTTGTTIAHAYTLTPAQEIRFAATVTLKDAANNTTTVNVIPAPVFNDFNAPTGSFSVSPATAWATLTKVKITQNSLNDDRTPAKFITRSVDWGDGTPATRWTGTGPATHVYVQPGSHTPSVTLTDEAGNSSPAIGTSPVVVKADTVAPRLTVAKARPRHSVKAWRTLHGTATDTAGTGVKKVTVKAVEKRGAAWYGYSTRTHRWIKAATQARAFQRAVAFTLKTNASHRWSATLRALTKGRLVVKASATDRVANRSAVVTRQAALTTR